MLRTASSTGPRSGRRRIGRLRALGVAVITGVAVVGVSSAAPGAAPAGSVDPGTVELTLGPGQSATVAKRVTTPAVAPKPDIVILGDTTGSMDPVVANVRNNINTIINRVRESQPNAQFAVTAYKEQRDLEKVFKVFTPLTPDAALVRDGTEQMVHDVSGGGAPWTDFINAHHQISTGAIAFRPNSTRLIAWYGDATSHDPSLGHTLADTNAALRAIGARVIAVPVIGTSGDGLDRLGQATSIVNATGGRLMGNSNSSQVAQAILDGISSVDVTVTPQVTSCDSALSVSFDPASRTVQSGTDANFNETFRVRPDAAAGTYRCSVDFLVNGVSQGFVQNTTVHVPGLSIGDVTVTEGDSGTTLASFPVTLDRAPTSPVTVHWATAGDSATQPGDYLTRGGDLTFAPGQPTSQQVEVPIVGDLSPEQTERFIVNLTNSGGAAITKAAGTGTILDNDRPGTPRVSIGDVTITEGDSGTAQATFTVSLDQASASEVTVQAATSDGTAGSPADYTGKTELITFPPGQTSRPFTVDIVGDLIDEPDETFTATLTNPVNATFGDDTGSGTIVDNDPPPSLRIGDVTVTEGDNGVAIASFPVTLDRPSAGQVTVNVATADDSATQPSDYVQFSGPIAFQPGQTSQLVDVQIVGDLLVEDTERFFVNLTNAGGATIADDQGVGTILDTDPGSDPTLSIGDVTVTEGDSGVSQATFTVTLSRMVDVPVSVQVATRNGSAEAPGDFTARIDRLPFAPGQTSQSFTVDIVGDLVDEGDEAFTAVLSDPSNAALGDDTGTGTILDNDPPPNLNIGDVTVTEGDSGLTTATFAVTLDRPSAGQVSVNAATADDTATQPSDYLPVDMPITFQPGQISRPVDVQIVGDLLVEQTERFFVNLTNAGGATIADGQGVGTILDTDPPAPIPVMSISDVSVAEGDTGAVQAVFTISLDRPTPLEVAVDWATADDTAVAPGDYSTSGGRAIFAPNQTSREITVPVIGDVLDEDDERFTVNLSDESNATVGQRTGIGTILDDDDPPPGPVLSIGDVTVTEGNAGTTQATFTISANPAPTAGAVTVSWATADGSATLQDNDYTAAGGTETFDIGQATRQVTVNVIGDSTVEPDETFAVNLANPTGGATIGDGSGEGRIVNDDPVNPPTNHRLSIGDVTVVEGNGGVAQATFTISLTRGTGTGPVAVDWATADGSARVDDNDYAAGTGREIFTGDQTTKQVTVNVIGDTRVEPDETFTVNLSNPTEGAELTDPQGAGTIRNDDVAGRSGVFTCTATALSLLGSAANPANKPCRDDAKTTPLANVNLGLVNVKANALTATTDQTPDILSGNPAAGDNATSTAELGSVRIRTLGLSIEVSVITSTASARCVAGPNGLVPQFSGSSSIAALKINGVSIPVGSGSITIPLIVGSLELNTTVTTGTSVTQRAFALNTLLGGVVIGEAKAGVAGTPSSPNGNPCRS